MEAAEGLEAPSGRRRRIVVATSDPIGASMAGPGIRAWQIARALAPEHDVRLVSTAAVSLTGDGFAIEHVDARGYRDAHEWCEVLIGQGWVLADRPALWEGDAVVVADAYDPMHLEQLEQGRDGGPRGWWEAVNATAAVLSEQLLRADFVLCASERQRDFWLGHLAALGRVNPATYGADPTLRSLIDVVPFGLEAVAPKRTGPGLRDRIPAIGKRDPIVLWGGGIYSWFDPLTLIEAARMASREVPNLRVVFLGGSHPNPEIPTMQAAVEARRRADDLGLTGTTVHFLEGWVPYGERHDVLLDATVGVSIFPDHVETDFSFRTRVLDYIWAGLPIISTRGDAMAEVVERHGLGLTVPPGDVDALARALVACTSGRQPGRAKAFAAARAELSWPVALEPLLRFCRDPRPAPDVHDRTVAWRLGGHDRALPTRGLGVFARRWRTVVHEGGLLGLLSAAGRRVRPGRRA